MQYKQPCLRETINLRTMCNALIRLFKMKVVIRKIFKFKSHLKHHQRKEEKLKVMYRWESGTKLTYFCNYVFFFKIMLFFVCFFNEPIGRKLDSDTDATGDEASFKVTMVDNSILLFFCAVLTSHLLQWGGVKCLKITSQIPCVLNWPVFSTSFVIYISDFLIN